NESRFPSRKGRIPEREMCILYYHFSYDASTSLLSPTAGVSGAALPETAEPRDPPADRQTRERGSHVGVIHHGTLLSRLPTLPTQARPQRLPDPLSLRRDGRHALRPRPGPHPHLLQPADPLPRPVARARRRQPPLAGRGEHAHRARHRHGTPPG